MAIFHASQGIIGGMEFALLLWNNAVNRTRMDRSRGCACSGACDKLVFPQVRGKFILPGAATHLRQFGVCIAAFCAAVLLVPTNSGFTSISTAVPLAQTFGSLVGAGAGGMLKLFVQLYLTRALERVLRTIS